MPTVMRVSGPYERLRDSILNTPFTFQEAVASRKRRESGTLPQDEITTFNFTISDFAGDCVPAQIQESALFLTHNGDAISRLRTLPGVEDLCLDFSWDFPKDSIGQINRFPCSLLTLCATLGVDIDVSVYSVSERVPEREADHK